MSEGKKKLDDLRVIDLRNELEKRDLDKNGNKALLMDRLRQALEKEEHNPDDYDFGASINDSFKKSSRRKSGRNSDLETDEGLELQNKFESFNDLVTVDGSDNVDESGDDDNGPVNDDESRDVTEDDVVDEDDESLLAKNVSQSEGVGDEAKSDDATPGANLFSVALHEEATTNVDVESALLISSQLQEGAELNNDDEPVPNPELVEPQCMFTSEDTIKLHEASDNALNADAKNCATDETNSMFVNADDTLSDDMSDVTSAKNGKSVSSGDTLQQSTATPPSEQQEATVVAINKIAAERCVVLVIKENNGSDDQKQETNVKSKTDVSKKANDTKSPDCSMWIIGIPSTIKAADLKSLFSKYGRVTTAKVMSSKSKTDGAQWFGFITMASPEEASKCITNLHRTELHGKMISVERASDSKGNALQLRKVTNLAASHQSSDSSSTDKSKMPAAISTGDGKKETSAVTGTKKLAAASAVSKPGAKMTTVKKTLVSTGSKAGVAKTAEKKPAANDKDEKSDTKKKDEGGNREKSKEKDDGKKRSVSKSRSTKSPHDKRSSRDHRVGRINDYRNVLARRRAFSGRSGPRGSMSYRGGVSSQRGGRFVPPSERPSYQTVRSGYSPYRNGVSSPRSREQEMLQRMRDREEEHRRREEQLRFEREKERLRFEREKLERERIQLEQQRQQMRMQMVYERSAVMNATQSMMGVKRAYEGLDPYSMAPESKRSNYGDQALPPPSNTSSRNNRRSPPPRSSFGGGRNSSSYRGNSTSAPSRDNNSRYESQRSSDRMNGRSNGVDQRSSRRDRSRYDSSPRRPAPSAVGRQSSWDRSGQAPSRRDVADYSNANAGTLTMDAGTWPSAQQSTAAALPMSQWRALPSTASTAAIYSGSSNAYSMYGAVSGGGQNSSPYMANSGLGAGAGGSNSSDRFDSYKYQSSRRY